MYQGFQMTAMSIRLLLFLLVVVTTTLITVSGLSTASPVAVIGGTGRLGRLAVQQLLDRQIPCHFLVRRFPQCDSPASLEDCTTSEQVAAFFQQHPNITLYEGDVTNRAALQALVQDCQACLALWGSTRRSKVSDIWNPNIADTDSTHAKQVNYQGVVNLIEACQLGQCPRIIRITGKGEDPTGIFTILINLFGSMAKAWNYQGEQALRASPVDYTIIRPGVMSEQGPAAKGTTKTVSLKLADNGGDLPVARIRYADIATLCLDCLEYPNTARCTLTAMTGENDGDAEVATSWKPMLAQVQADRRQFPSDMLDQHYAAVKKVLYTLGGILAIAIFGVFKTISSWLL